MTELNLEKKIDQFLTKKENELARERRNQERSKAWEKNKPAFFNTLKFFGATALLAGGLYLGTAFVDSLPEPDVAARKARREQKIEALQADSISYENAAADLQLINNSLAEQNERLNTIVTHEKSRRNIFGNLKRSERKASSQTVQRTQEGNNVLDLDKHINQQQPRVQTGSNTPSQTTVGPAREHRTAQQPTSASSDPPRRYQLNQQQSPVTKKIRGRGTNNALVRVWQNGEVYAQQRIADNDYTIAFSFTPEHAFIIDSITAELANYQRKSINYQNTIINRDLQVNFFLERLSSSAERSQLEQIVEPTFRERRGKRYLEQAQQPYTHPLIVNRGEIVVIPAGTIVTGESTFRIIVDGGTLEIKGRSNNPVRINARGNWQGITYLNSTGNVIEYCELVNAQSVNRHAGGAITMKNSDVSIEHSIFKNNKSIGNGGTIRAENSNLEIKNSTLDAGRASGNGGNIYLLNTRTDILNSQLFNGQAQNGGNIYVQNTEGSTQQGLLKYPLLIKRSVINYGTANENGGGIAIIQTLIETQQTTGTGNKANYGGAIYGNKGIYNFARDSYFRRNEATISGGGAYIEGIEVVDDALRKPFQDNSRNNVVIK
jgi:hypothetical protein